MPSSIARPRAALALACLAAVSLPTFAQAPLAAAAGAAVDPDRIVVVGTREPTEARRLAGDIVVIDAEAIQASTADSLEDLLRREAGLQLSRNGAPGTSAALLMRGGGSGNTLVLVDGVRIGSATLGLAEFEGLSLASVERVEVLRGPGSSLYGADGSGGVVQIFTRRGDGKTRVGAWLAAGQYGAAEGALNASAGIGAVDASASLSHERMDGVSSLRPGDQWGNHNPDHDGFKRSTATGQLGWRFAQGHRLGLSVLQSKLDAQYDGSEFLPPDFEQDATPDFRNKLENNTAALEHRADWSAAWASTLRLSTQESDLHSGGTVIQRFRTRRQQVDVQATWKPVAGQRLTFAYIGTEEKADIPAYARQRDNQALVLAYLGDVGGVQVQADLRHDDNSAYGNVGTGRLGASYELTKGWRVRALAGTAFRAPSFNETDYPFYGDPDIRPERGRSVEFGVDGRWSAYELSATAWHNRVRDLIGYQPDAAQCPDSPDYMFGCAANIADAKLQGLTLSAGAQLGDWWLRAQADFTDAKNADSGDRLNRRAAHQVSLSADYTWGAWRFGAAVLQVGARPDGVGYTLPEETTLDLKARWQFARDWTLELKVINATDEDLEPARDYQGLGRQAWLGVRYAFGGR